jgi:hypothetical protein
MGLISAFEAAFQLLYKLVVALCLLYLLTQQKAATTCWLASSRPFVVSHEDCRDSLGKESVNPISYCSLANCLRRFGLLAGCVRHLDKFDVKSLEKNGGMVPTTPKRAGDPWCTYP